MFRNESVFDSIISKFPKKEYIQYQPQQSAQGINNSYDYSLQKYGNKYVHKVNRQRYSTTQLPQSKQKQSTQNIRETKDDMLKYCISKQSEQEDRDFSKEGVKILNNLYEIKKNQISLTNIVLITMILSVISMVVTIIDV